MLHDEFCCRLFLSVSQMQLSRGFRAWHVAVASAPDKVPRSCPGQAATRKRCGVERGPRSRAFAAAWAPALRRTAEGALRRVRGTRPKSIFVFQSTESAHLRLLAACAARALRHSLPPKMPRAQGRPGAGWHPRSTVRRLRYKRLHSGIQVKPNTRPSLRSGFTAYVVISPGERCTIAPVALRMADADARSGRPHHHPVGPPTSPQDLTHRPRASGPHDLMSSGFSAC